MTTLSRERGTTNRRWVQLRRGVNVSTNDRDQLEQDSVTRNSRRLDDMEARISELQLRVRELVHRVDDLTTSLEQMALAIEFFTQRHNTDTETN